MPNHLSSASWVEVFTDSSAMHAHRNCRHDPIDLSDESWQPTKLELQARLGASKERQLELEWRLQQAEQKVAQAQVHHLDRQQKQEEI